MAWRNYLQGDDRTKNPIIKVMYSSPAKKDREIFGSLIPYGTDWRLGANEATEVSFYRNVEVNGQFINQGIYSLFAEIQEDYWVVSFSTERNLWGSENRDKSRDVASIKVPVTKAMKTREHLAIAFREINEHLVHMIIEWGDTKVEVPIAFNVAVFPGEDLSPADLVQYPDNSRYVNYLKDEEKDNAKAKVRITYGRPQKKDRNVFGELIKFGSVWRVGANESTEIGFYEPVMIGDQELAPRRYNLYAEVNEGEWTFIFNTDMPAWGSANRNEEMDVARITVPVTTEEEVVEALSIRFEKIDDSEVHAIFAWDTTRAALPIKFK